ncbi:sporulation membrane protein YtaF [Metabacillus sp. RGM 3146]|uniref:sporulation membrane protein YtaF n=1 Tax=Metabacillus sp. RGM 3146 TaxID=3401092 RepID=UPI003B9D895D
MISLQLFILAIAVSLDSFSVGFTYGLRKTKIPGKSIFIIACCSAASLLAAMFIGHALIAVFPESVTKELGGYILIAIGAWVLIQFFLPEKEHIPDEDEKTIFNLEIKSLGIVIHILRRPSCADIDKSGAINGIEALLLGLALSLDSFGAGFGAALLGYSPIVLSISVAVMSSVFLIMGLRSGRLFSALSWLEKFTFIPGILLILIGIWKL